MSITRGMSWKVLLGDPGPGHPEHFHSIRLRATLTADVLFPHPSENVNMTSGTPTTPAVSSSTDTPKPASNKPASKTKARKKPAGKKPATRKHSVAKKPAGTKSSKDINKAAEIRRVATAMTAKKQKPRPSLIMAELKKQGVAVSSPQVSMTLKKMGFRPLRRRKKAAAATSGNAAAPKVAATSTSKAAAVSLDDLLAAKKMAGTLGGTDKAIAALQALKRVEG